MKGRKPSSDNIVPLTSTDGGGANFSARAIARSRELKPEGLPFSVSCIWDRIAPPLCDPRKSRLNESNAFMFEMLCYTIDRHERLRVEIADKGEFYENSGRNGKLEKARARTGQLNVTWDQIRKLGGDFGMTPAAERGLQGGGQLGFDFNDGDGFD